MQSRRQVKARKRALLVILIFFLAFIGFGLFKIAKYFPVFWDLTFKKEVALKQTPEKRVNLLLLGVGGGTHEGPDLTDTVIFASLDPETKHVTLVSLPRDLWVPDISAKINASYHYGEEKQKGGGLALTKAVVSKVLGQQIDYAVKIDFSGFEKAVDMMGGLDIDVANTFDDYAYPITGEEEASCGFDEEKIASLSAEIATASATESEAFPCRYEHLHFDSGVQHMDGVTALKYVRSRHALGREGSDFARSKRQEKVITAFKDKLFSAGTILNPGKVLSLMGVLEGSIEMDIQQNEIDDFVRLAQKLKGAKINSAIIDAGEGERLGLLINPPISQAYGRAWVLSPRIGNGNYAEIQKYVSCIIVGNECEVTKNGVTTITPTLTP